MSRRNAGAPCIQRSRNRDSALVGLSALRTEVRQGRFGGAFSESPVRRPEQSMALGSRREILGDSTWASRAPVPNADSFKQSTRRPWARYRLAPIAVLALGELS